ncbi:hypothetical protein U6A24_03955 [Aquimarina gracilis]|uniref:Uncharacterized protein n=1 Tax=Aquimarina gracilis TaxID=874422 RepID=A0ABU5ZR99_9FLAO|nr:hypothetical protein [Aquimarina gracilis]MEB3344600.1 hypothetical protein [Aquimarina gracilis]
MNITYSTELMRNYKQSEVISPQKKFQALQTDLGEALLFSIGTDGVFYLIQQSSGQDATGWQEVDLSGNLSKLLLSNATVKDFAVAENPSNGKIDLMVVITADNKDTLYISLGHSNKQGSITSDIVWTVMPYDDPSHKGISPNIADIFISNSSLGEYLVVDISESSFTPPSNFLKRYYIDPKKTTGTYWNPMVIGGDLDPGVQTRIGRKTGQRVDGTYTLGSIGGVEELLYAPLYNPFDRSAPPTITRLKMPKGASAIAVADTGDGTTDLFVSANTELYLFPADKQEDNATGTKVYSSELFQDAVELHAFKSNSEYIIWGLNRADQVFYTSCKIADILDPTKWSLPLPIITNVTKISAFINKDDDANTIFSSANNVVNISVKSPTTSIWNTQKIHLAAPPSAKADSFSSYTTRVQLNDGKNNPLANTEVLVAASSPIPVYINHIYYNVNATPIPVTSDNLGSITIVEAIGGLDSTTITISQKGGASVTINPMKNPIEKSVSLDTKEKLKNAVIKNPDGTTKPLISTSISDADLESVASANKNLASAYTSVTTNLAKRVMLSETTIPVLQMSSGETVSTIATDIGDIFNWLKSGIEHTIEIVKDEITGIWHFIVKIAGEFYRGVLDTIEAVAGAVRWVYNIIKVAIEDLLKFLEFLFEWKDITRTKEVLKNLLKNYLQHEADQIEVVKEEINEQINKLVSTINGWAGIDDWNGLGAAASSPTNSSSTPNKNSSAPGNLLSFHTTNNAQNIVQKNSNGPLNPGTSLIDTLIEALKKESVVIDAVFDQLKTLSTEYDKLDLGTILKRIIAIIADGVLESAEVVIDAMLDIVYELINAVLDALDTDIYIPVVSDILKDFGIPSLSFLDLFCWVSAVPVTLAYKIAEGAAPFPDNNTTTFLKTAKTWKSIEEAFAKGQNLRSTNKDLITIPDSAKTAIFVSGHAASGFFTLMSCFISTFEAEAETGENPFSIPSAILGVLAAGTNGIAGVLVPKAPVKNTIVSWVSKATTASVILAKLIFSGPAQKKFGAASGTMKILKAADGRATGAIVNSILVIPALACTCWHFYELAQQPASSTRSAAIIDETANLTSYISRISYAVAVNDPDPETKQIPIAVMVVANVATSGLQTAEAIVGAPNEMEMV